MIEVKLFRLLGNDQKGFKFDDEMRLSSDQLFRKLMINKGSHNAVILIEQMRLFVVMSKRQVIPARARQYSKKTPGNNQPDLNKRIAT